MPLVRLRLPSMGRDSLKLSSQYLHVFCSTNYILQVATRAESERYFYFRVRRSSFPVGH